MSLVKFIKGLKRKVICLSITSLLFSCSYSVFSQNIKEVNFNAKWLAFSNPGYFPNTQAMMLLEGDSVINLSFNKSDSTFHHMGERWHYRLNTHLNVIDSFQVWQRQSSHRPSVSFDELAHSVTLIQDGFNKRILHYETLILDDSTMEINLYSSKINLDRDSLLFKTQISDVRKIVPYVYDTTLNIMIAVTTGIAPSMRSYGLLSGNLIAEDSAIAQGFFFNPFSFLATRKVIPSPQDPEEIFMFANGPTECMIRLNWKKQKIEQMHNLNSGNADDSLLFRYGVVNEEYYDVHIEDTNSFRFVGTHKNSQLFSTQNFSYQVAIHEINNQDSLLSVREYGNPSSPNSNDVIGLIYRKFGNTEYILGRDNDRWGFNLPDTMQMVLYTIDSNGVDSLYIHGYGNHMPLDMQRMSNGDIYICSALSANQSNYQVYVSVTKIPASLLTDIKEQKISRKLYLYPNPTVDILKSSEFISAEEIRVYNLKGSQVKSFYGRRESISLDGLDFGTYIIQTITNGKIESGIVIKH